MAETDLHRDIATVRGFNRFYTQKIGVLREGLLESPFSLAEARVLYEIAHREAPTAAPLARELGLDPGYLSRILRALQKGGLIARTRSSADGRQAVISLTSAGRDAFAGLDARSKTEISRLLQGLEEANRRRLVNAMATILGLLQREPQAGSAVTLRPHRPGDLGWVVSRHGALYAEEYGWDERFEALVAEIVAAFVQNLDPQRERCWIAERDGQPIGSVFLVKQSAKVAKLRLLLVEPSARGLGVGSRLVAECLGFAGLCGYRSVTLWTNSILDAARHIYARAGFQLVAQEAHHSFGHDLIGENWELALPS
ncbi:MAG: MarR family transcriptional regulator [Alphaproteobacteria bacterium]|nr:MarR family transcriptional regulator [Alphaproteobacteria bacterium]